MKADARSRVAESLENSARSHLVLLRGGPPSWEKQKNYRAPHRLSMKLQTIHMARGIVPGKAIANVSDNVPLSVERGSHTCYFSLAAFARVAEWQTLRT